MNTQGSLQLSNDTALALEPTSRFGGSDLSQGGTSLGIPTRFEKRWLLCWSEFLFYTLKFSPSGIVMDDMEKPEEPRPGATVSFHFPCGRSLLRQRKTSLTLPLSVFHSEGLH